MPLPFPHDGSQAESIRIDLFSGEVDSVTVSSKRDERTDAKGSNEEFVMVL